MAEALASAGGWRFVSRGWGRQDENTKAILSHLKESGESSLYFDNVDGMFGSHVLAGVLTSATYGERELGKTRDLKVATNCLMMMSANAYDPTKDMAVRMIEIGLVPQKVNPGWMPVDKVDHEEFVSLAFALAEYVRDRFDRAEVMRGIRNAKFPHWDDVVRYMTVALTGVDPMSVSDDRGESADWDDNYEILAVLDAVWNKATPDERASMTSSQIAFWAGDALVEGLTDKFKMKPNKFGYALEKYQRNRGSTVGGNVGEYLFELIADRKHDGAETKRYRLTKPGCADVAVATPVLFVRPFALASNSANTRAYSCAMVTAHLARNRRLNSPDSPDAFGSRLRNSNEPDFINRMCLFLLPVLPM